MTQIHDFNPGINPFPSGLFWTIRFPEGSVHVDLDNATASMRVNNKDVEDYFSIGNALSDGPSIPANVFYHIRWSGVTDRVHVRDTTNHFVGDFIEDAATVAWSASESGFAFTSDPADTSVTAFAEIGQERNGVFFS
ncbi:MAG TPA: hypothetical protein VKQ30_18920 [Ktedonobacterales bacterium]|nr:hypothetical protein [Ktedonobacterales bacterium]